MNVPYLSCYPVMDVLRKLEHPTRVMVLSRNAQHHHETKSQKFDSDYHELVSDCPVPGKEGAGRTSVPGTCP